jgi:WD40 repeat protein
MLDKLLIGGRDCKLHILRKRDKKELNIINAHTSTINHISSLNDLIITASRDKSIRIWTEDIQLVQSIHTIHGGHHNSVNFILPVDSNSFYTCSDDRSIMRWSIE